ncbi:MAG TPA: hydroxymethylbilane synthase [Candidatus Dormibacteraeota bacterium]|jgi:hydroxymethylbilane synthase|nr:hydroxymethylbilane synthase [Candidatus Dormibacteraeota bacterium]
MRIGTRGSALALVQAELVRRAYLERFPDREVQVVVIRTEGDRRADVPLSSIGGSGVFVKEIQARLLAGEIDCAVHSAKDLAVAEVEGLELAAFLPRAPAHDVLIRRPTAATGTAGDPGERFGGPPGAGFRIATGSPRRRAQLGDAWPGVEFVEIRGNVDTRLRKLEEGAADGLVLAAAGLRRLGLQPQGEAPIPISVCVPSPAQGAIVAQARLDDPAAADLRWLNHLETSLAVSAERDMAAALGASCTLPLGVHVEFRGGETRLLAALHDGRALHRLETRSAAGDPAEAVRLAMAELRDRGVRW